MQNTAYYPQQYPQPQQGNNQPFQTQQQTNQQPVRPYLPSQTKSTTSGQYSIVKQPALYTIGFFILFNLIMTILFVSSRSNLSTTTNIDKSLLLEEERKNAVKFKFFIIHFVLLSFGIIYLVIRKSTFAGLSILSILTTFLICFVTMYLPPFLKTLKNESSTSSDNKMYRFVFVDLVAFSIFSFLLLICLGYDYMNTQKICCDKITKKGGYMPSCSKYLKP